MPACWTVCRHSNVVWRMAYGELGWMAVSQLFPFWIFNMWIFSRRLLCSPWILDSTPIIWNWLWKKIGEIYLVHLEWVKKIVHCIWQEEICEGEIWMEIAHFIDIVVVVFNTRYGYEQYEDWRCEKWKECIRFWCINRHLWFFVLIVHRSFQFWSKRAKKKRRREKLEPTLHKNSEKECFNDARDVLACVSSGWILRIQVIQVCAFKYSQSTSPNKKELETR